MFSLLFLRCIWNHKPDGRTIKLEERENDNNDESATFDKT